MCLLPLLRTTFIQKKETQHKRSLVWKVILANMWLQPIKVGWGWGGKVVGVTEENSYNFFSWEKLIDSKKRKRRAWDFERALIRQFWIWKTYEHASDAPCSGSKQRIKFVLAPLFIRSFVFRSQRRLVLLTWSMSERNGFGEIMSSMCPMIALFDKVSLFFSLIYLRIIG